MGEDGLKGLRSSICMTSWEKLKPQRWGDLWVSEATVEGWLHRATQGDFLCDGNALQDGGSDRVTLHRCQSQNNYV